MSAGNNSRSSDIIIIIIGIIYISGGGIFGYFHLFYTIKW